MSSRIPRFFCPPPLADLPEQLLVLPDNVARHAAQVLRLPPGGEMILFDGTGGEYPARIQQIERGKVVAHVGARRAIERESPLAVTLAQALQAGEKMDYTLQKAVELGVAAFLPLTGRRSVIRLADDRARKREAHWHGVAIAACEQCGRNRLPAIGRLASLEAWLHDEGRNLPGLKLILAPEASRRFAELEKPAAGEPVTLLVGAEGGLDPAEIDSAQKAGFQPIRLGPRILRTETAGIAALSILQSHWGDL
ncbi:MAG: 16S rRNA (uracil(1498)-N(3))-methyltransferase [Zoogloeaceae bacterium]|jgi:16S rRNA (uracil1498-N3)-methyltransferase|nr:16S rRNA (uracil(1498)-N(3))-methyltransferase [Zoogloeaceae bacterium]